MIDRHKFARDIAEAKKARDAAIEQAQSLAAERAARLSARSRTADPGQPCPLAKKFYRTVRSRSRACWCFYARDGHGKLINLQFISSDGSKGRPGATNTEPSKKFRRCLSSADRTPPTKEKGKRVETNKLYLHFASGSSWTLRTRQSGRWPASPPYCRQPHHHDQRAPIRYGPISRTTLRRGTGGFCGPTK